MRIDEAAIAFLCSPAAERAFLQLSPYDILPGHELNALTRLRSELSGEQAALVLEQSRLRVRAAADGWPAAHRLVFSREGLEQSTHPAVARWHASGVGGRVADICCGIGCDSLAFAGAGCVVTGFDRDESRLAIARHNAEILGLEVEFRQADARVAEIVAGVAFFDPGRRTETGRRIDQVERYHPPLSTLLRFDAQRLMAKLSPGVDIASVASYGGTLTFVSLEGALKEALLEPGPGILHLRAVLLADGAVHEFAAGPVEPAEAATVEGVILEPDPAILRSRLVGNLALEIGAAQVDSTVAYLVAPTMPSSPWVRGWQIVAVMPFDRRRLRQYLRAHDGGVATVKKRGVDVDPAELARTLRGRGMTDHVVVLTRRRGRRIAIVCEPEALPAV